MLNVETEGRQPGITSPMNQWGIMYALTEGGRFKTPIVYNSEDEAVNALLRFKETGELYLHEGPKTRIIRPHVVIKTHLSMAIYRMDQGVKKHLPSEGK